MRIVKMVCTVQSSVNNSVLCGSQACDIDDAVGQTERQAMCVLSDVIIMTMKTPSQPHCRCLPVRSALMPPGCTCASGPPGSPGGGAILHSIIQSIPPFGKSLHVLSQGRR